MYKTIISFLILLLAFTSCQENKKATLKIAATSIPHAEILEFIKPKLKEYDIALDILIIDDFNTPNRALAEKEVDANFFQHLPFLQSQIADFGYPLEPFVSVHLEPMALYSTKHSSLKKIPTHATIAIPSDPSNQARALSLCHHAGLIQLQEKGIKATLQDITSNPLQLQFIEMDSPLLSRALEDVDLAAITTNFALLAHLSPQRDALAIESTQSDFVNIVAIRQGERTRTDLLKLKEALKSDEVKEFIKQKYQGAVLPAFFFL